MVAGRRGVAVAGLIAGALGALAGGAVAASGSVEPSAHFKGSGGDYMNNAPTWSNEGKGQFTFQTNSTGNRILKFHGSYQFYCGAGTGSVMDNSIAIAANGHFAARGHYQEHSHGKVTGTNYLRVWGRFAGSGKSATVDYLSDFVYAGKTVKNPYSTKIKSDGDSCESWVRGKATAT
jgi:hypothetical protein